MSFEEVNVCPACDSQSFHHLHICKDSTASDALFHVKQCDACGLAITSPRPSANDAHIYYESKTYISHTSSSSGILDSIYLIIRGSSIKWKFSLAKKYLRQGPLLDFGCGTGHFLQHCTKNKIQSFGIEPSPQARKKIALSIQVAGSLKALPQINFDVITLWHVLEHVYPLLETLHDLKNRLNENGTIIIAVPNLKSQDAVHYKETWAAYDVPRHLWHFSRESMTTLLTKSGLEIREIIPMKLDAYYVSLLSEKNKLHGSLTISKFFGAILNGLQSNLLARKTQDYSSLIYVVQKK